MLFVEFRFLVFFLIVFCVHWAIRSNTGRKIWLLGCSYFFYGAWDWRFLLILMASTAMDFTIGRMLTQTEDPRRRKGWVALSLCINLGLLGFFKYFNFFVASATSFALWLGLPAHWHTLNIIIPVGVSFFTFQSMSYTLEVYRRHQPAERSLLDLAFFIAFFPQLVAGPIVRAMSFLPQTKTKREFSRVDIRGALVLFLIGFVKKACVAEGVAPFVDRYFGHPESYTALSAWLGVVLYAIQIYCDFSGYTDMANACARLLGYELAVNFNFPYFARNIGEFWHRWHISLSSWLRDYLYISLGGNRGSKLFTYRNLMFTMVLGGLWHGGGWNFVIWGLLHGVALVGHRELSGRLPKGFSFGWFGTGLTFYWVCIAWIFFRAVNLSDALVALRGFVLFQSSGTSTLDPRLGLIILGLGLMHGLNSRRVFSGCWKRLPEPVFAASFGCITAAILLFVPTKHTPFIYFQF